MHHHHFYQIGKRLSRQYGPEMGEILISLTNLSKRVEKLEMLSAKYNLQRQTQTQTIRYTQRQTQRQIQTFRSNEINDYHKLIEYQKKNPVKE